MEGGEANQALIVKFPINYYLKINIRSTDDGKRVMLCSPESRLFYA